MTPIFFCLDNWLLDFLGAGPIQRLRIRGEVADMPSKNEQVSLDMFLEVEHMALDCGFAFSACHSWEGWWNDVEGPEKADFQRLFWQQGAE